MTTVASEAWIAEIFAKAAFVAGLDEGIELLEEHGVAGLFTDDRGRHIPTAAWDEYSMAKRRGVAIPRTPAPLEAVAH